MSRLKICIVILLLTLAPSWAAAQRGTVVVLNIAGPIGPATADYVHRGMQAAQEQGAVLVVLTMDTPGGLDTAMRSIIQDILASPVPVASLVAPSGARAASAGTYILYASHIAAMAPGTNLGAATPVQLGGAPTPGKPEAPKPAGTPLKQPGQAGDGEAADKESGGSNKAQDDSAADEAAPDMSDPHKAKQVNDAIAYIRSLAQLRGRNVEWAERAVRHAASLPAEEALEINVIDLIANDLDDLLAKIDGRTVNVMGNDRVLDTADVDVVTVDPDWRNRLLSVITDPNILPILMTLGMLGLLYELINPGFVLPGVLGAICLVLALYASQVLPVNYAGVALILLGIAFMVGEAFAPSFGALGIGGVIAFIIGSIILIDTEAPGFGVSIPFIVTFGVVMGMLFFALMTMVVKMRRSPIVSGREQLVGASGEVLESFDAQGRVRVHSETWTARSQQPLQKGDRVRVVGVEGLLLDVEPDQKPQE